MPLSGFVPRFTFHGVTRLAVKLDFIAGLFSRALDTTGSGGFRGPQTAVGEVIAWRNLFWGLSDAMALNPIGWPGTDGYVQPNLNSATAYRVFAPMAYNRIKELIERHIASGLIYLPSSAKDFANPEIAAMIEKTQQSPAANSHDRVKFYKLAWDAVGSEFGSRHHQYEMFYAGATFVTKGHSFRTYDWGKAGGIVQSMLDSYDLDSKPAA